MSNELEKKKEAGRPSVLTPERTAKLEEIFKLAVTDAVACDYAELDPATFYRHVSSDPDFARKIRQAKDYGRLAAGSVVMDSIVKKHDIDSAKWWLERKHPNEFGNRPVIAQQFNFNSLEEAKDEDIERIIS